MIKKIMTQYALKKDLGRTIKELKREYGVDADIKVGLYNILDKTKISIDGNQLGWAASIIKVPLMVSILEEIEKDKLSLDTQLEVDHRFTLESSDFISRLPEGSYVPVKELLYHMIVESDNEATNILADEIGIDIVNNSAWNLGLGNTMFGHLLCSKAPRYSSKFNPDGSNVTCPDDMVTIMRHIYDDSFSKLSPRIRELSDSFLSATHPMYLNQGKFEKGKRIKAKIGLISDPEDGSDIHEVGIIDDYLIVCIMLNKFDQNKKELQDFSIDLLEKLCESKEGLDGLDDELKNILLYSSPSFVYRKIMRTIGEYVI